MAQAKLICPACGGTRLDLRGYESMMVLSNECALFSVRCPDCKTTVSTVQMIPAELRSDVSRAAARVGAGMGRQLY